MARSAGPARVPLEFPIGGLNTVAGYAQQPKGTTPSCMNVMPFDPGSGRGRGGQRAGVRRIQTAANAGLPVTLLMQVDLTQQLPAGVNGFAPTGVNLETSFVYPGGVTPGIFNAVEAGTPWSAWGDNTLLANAVFHDGTATLDNAVTGRAQVYGASASVAAFNGGAVFLPAGTGVTTAKRSLTIKRQGNAAPAGAWGPVYQATVLMDVTQGWGAGRNDRVYLLFVADGSGGTVTGKLAAGVAVRDNQYLEFVTLADNAAPVVATTIDLVAQFNHLFPTAPGGPITALASAGVTWLTVSLCKQAAASNTYLAQVSVIVGANTYTWVVGQTTSPTTAQTLVTAAQGGVQDSIVLALDTPNALFDGYFQLAGVTQATVNVQVNPGTGRDVQLVEVQAGNIYLGHPGSMTVTTNGAGVFSPYQLINAAYGQYKAYLVDGTVTKQLDLQSGVVTDFAAAGGKGALPAGCQIAVMWRDRLVLARQAGSEQNIYASRQGDYTDWVFGSPDAQSAWSLNATTAGGHVGEPVMAFAPVSDDVALIGCSSSTFAMKGDPAAGGSVMQVSSQIGVFGQRAWCLDPKGALYFVGTGGFFRWHAGLSGYYGEQALENLSDKKCPQFFAGLDRSTTNVCVRWDTDRHGAWIIVAPFNMQPATCLWFDGRTEGFFPQAFPAGVAPTSIEEFDADNTASRAILLGGADGSLRKLDPTLLTDDGGTISSFVHVGPYAIADDFNQAVIVGMEFLLAADLGANPVNLAWSLRVASSPEGAFDAPTQTTGGTFTAGGRQPRQLARVRGNAVDLYLSNALGNATWAFERCALQLTPGGTNR